MGGDERWREQEGTVSVHGWHQAEAQIIADISSKLQQPQHGVHCVTRVKEVLVLIEVVPIEQIIIQRQGSRHICICIADLH